MNPNRSQLDENLSFEILKSERTLACVLLGILGLLFALSTIMGFVVPPKSNPMLQLSNGRFPFAATTIFFGTALLYESAVQAALGKAIRRRVRVPSMWRFGNTLAETSFPTILLVLVANALGPEISLNSPVMLLYLLLISLSTLRLTPLLSIWSGFLAAIEFAVLAFVYFPLRGNPVNFFVSVWPMVAKALIMVIAGVVCAFVAAQIRRRLIALLQSADEKHRVMSMFGQYVSPDVVEHLLHEPVDHGETRYVTVMFLDIRNFTSFSEHRAPAEVVSYLNTLFREMITVVNANHGMINKFLGDGFIACFGAPLSDGHDARNAVKAAIAIAELVENLNRRGAIPPTRIGIGLHSGPAVTGSIGSDERKEYTIIGDTVNLASRVEQLNKQYGSVLIVTDSVWEVVKDEYPGRYLDPAVVKGRAKPVGVYALL